MLVDKSNFDEAFKRLVAELMDDPVAAVDTETTALFWWRSPHYAIRPRVFSLQFSTEKTDYYFDFGCEESVNPLGEEHWPTFHFLFGLQEVTWFIHNAKFDLHHLRNHGIRVAGRVHCTLAIQRLVNNVEPSKGFSLDALAEKYLGEKKVDLAEYWKDERRTTKIPKPGQGSYDFLHFDRLPFDVLLNYGERDTRLCYRLGRKQRAEIAASNSRHFGAQKLRGDFDLTTVYDNECALTKTLMEIERQGVQLDMPTVKAAHHHATDNIRGALKELDQEAAPFLTHWNQTNPADRLDRMDWNSGPRLKSLFDFLGLPHAVTEKGRASFDENSLRQVGGQLGRKILAYRRHSKRAHTYLENYLWLADHQGVLHCDFSQGGTETGRLSCRSPNMQNVPKRADKKETDFILRRCFVPRAGKVLVSMDLDQAEYRLMLDYAGETSLINRILADKVNVHEATRQELGLADYDDAKTMNFRILYGSGLAGVAYSLYDCSISELQLKALCKVLFYRQTHAKDFADAQKLCDTISPADKAKHLEILAQAKAKLTLYKKKLPEVMRLMDRVKSKARVEGHIYTWLGRVLRYDVPNDWGSKDDYKAPNGLCQGGIGDLGKVQLNRAAKFLEANAKDSHIVLHVHDEVLAEFSPEDLYLVKPLVKLLADCYPHRFIPITAGAAKSDKSWGDLEDF